MANKIVAVSPSLSNTVSQIAHLFNICLQKHCNISIDCHVDYYQKLATLMGLGFTAILAEGSRIRSCRQHLVTFLRYRNFTQHPGKLEHLSHAIAEMICSAIYPFKVLKYPLYYDDFVGALVNALKSSDTADTKIEEGIKKMIKKLFEQCEQP